MANTTFNGPVRSEGGFKQITKNATTGVITENYSVSSTGQITAAASTTIFQYNYITCPPPVTSMLGNSAVGVLADGDKFGMMFFGPNGQVYPAACVSVGAFSAGGTAPMLDGTVPATDTATTHAGLNLTMDGETTDNVGLQMIPGGNAQGTGPHTYTVGTHSGSIDATFQAADYTDFDCIVIGFRKVEEFATGLNAAIAAATAGDLVYTDIVAFGAQGDTNIEIQTDLNNSGTSTSTDCGASVPVDTQNLRLKVNLSSAGVVTYELVVNAIAGEGTLAAPATTAAFTFDDGDVLVPYIATLKNGTATDELFLKDITVTRTPGSSFERL